MVSIGEFREVAEGKGLVIPEERWEAAERVLAEIDPRITEAEADTVSIHEAGHALLSLLTKRMPKVIWSSPYTHQVGEILGFRNMGMVQNRSESLTRIQISVSNIDTYKARMKGRSDEECLDEILRLAAGSVAQSILSEDRIDSSVFFEKYGRGDQKYIDILLDILLERLQKVTYVKLDPSAKAEVRNWVLVQISRSLYQFIIWGAEGLCGSLLEQISKKCREHIIMVGQGVVTEMSDCVRIVGDGDTLTETMGELYVAYERFRQSLLEAIRTPGALAFADAKAGILI